MITLDYSIYQLHQLGLISVRAMNVCRRANITNVQQIIDLDTTALLDIRNCGKKTLSEIQAVKTEYYKSLTLKKGRTEETEVLKTVLKEETQPELPCDSPPIAELDVTMCEDTDVELRIAELKRLYLPPISQRNLQNWVKTNFAQLSTRAKNLFAQYQDISNILKVLYADNRIELISLKKCGKKTSAEIADFFKRFKNIFEEYTYDIDTKKEKPTYSEQEILLDQIIHQFPFLEMEECSIVTDFKLNNNYLPVLFILFKYICRAENKRLQAFRDFYGFNEQRNRLTLEEIAKRQGLSRERVRQILYRGLPLPEGIHKNEIATIIKHTGNVIPFDSPLWNDIRKNNMLEDENVIIPLLLCSLTDYYTVVQIDDKDICYLVNRKLVENVKIRNVCNSLCALINAKRSEIVNLDILSFIKSDKRKYHRNVNLLCSIYSRFLSSFPNVNVIDDRNVLLIPNVVDASRAIESILFDKGSPMSLRQLFNEYNKLHSESHIASIDQFKTYIQRNKNIRPKGKRGIYVLAQWKDQFTGSIIEYIEQILRLADTPMNIDDILDFVLEEFPKTNKKSVYSLLSGSYGDRFIAYEGNYFGLVGQQYNQATIKIKHLVQRKSFDEHFSALTQFISLHRRMPIGSRVNDEEACLCRWMKNVQVGNIILSQDQLNQFNSFLAANTSIPQDGREYKFKIMCDRIKVVVAQTFALPSRSGYLIEYNWLFKYKNRYDKLGGNSKLYFEDLLLFLKNYGFYL